MEEHKEGSKEIKKIRIFIDGCWDIMHAGYYNAIRQAKLLGDVLVVGILNDEQIKSHKRRRQAVMKLDERLEVIKACKWVDEVHIMQSYDITVALLDKLNCDYAVHGDDVNDLSKYPIDAYEEVRKAGRMKIFPRVHCASTARLMQRLVDRGNDGTISSTPFSSFSATSIRIAKFFRKERIPKADDVVVYIDGVFDLFHHGQIAALKKAKECGTYLYVGLYDDAIVSKKKGAHFPLMSLQERVLNILSCKYVDDVIIGCNWNVTEEMIQSLNISHFVTSENTAFCKDEFDRYAVPMEMGIYQELKTEVKYSTDDLIQRVVNSKHQIDQEIKKQTVAQREEDNVITYRYVPGQKNLEIIEPGTKL